MTVDVAQVSEVLPGVWRADAEMMSSPYRISTNAYAVVSDGQALVVDTAWWAGVGTTHLDALLDIVEREDAVVREVFVTHAHRDHSGYSGYLAERLPANGRVRLHEAERPTVAAMRNYQGLPDRASAVDWYRRRGFPDDVAQLIVDTKMPDLPMSVGAVEWCEEGEVLTVGRRDFRVVGTPGHTPGHAALFEEATGILFCGDALLPKGHGNPHVTVRPFTSADPLTDYVSGVRGLGALDVRVCLPGHGPAVDDPSALIRAHLDYAHVKVSALRDVLDDRPRSAYDVASRLRWRGGRKRFDELVNDEWFLAFADTLARISRAVTLGWAERLTGDDGVPVYRAVR